MHLRTELTYDAPPDEVFAMLTDDEFVARKAQATGALSYVIDITDDTHRVTVELRRVMPPVVPDYVRRFVGDTVDIDQTDVWEPPVDGTRKGTFTAKIAGAPVSMTGTLTLRPGAAGHSVEVVEADVKAGVPFIGGKIEKAVGEAVLLAARKEEEVGRDWLAGRR
ncbi:MAG TPA: DUF2505 domain-containing protein [Jiangellales bacterium]|nr:DUF2505 domain-containing protein [Jiangellales bacterium]